MLPWLIVLTLAAVYGSRWLPHLQVGADGAFSLVGGGLPLPAATDRTYPRPGVEELETRLVPAVTTVDPGTGYAFQETQTDAAGVTVPVAWSPCRPVHLVVDPTGAPADFLTVVTTAAAEVSAATGLVLVVDGTTTEAAAPEREAYLPEQYGDRWAPALVRFTDDATVPGLAGDVVGLAGVQIVHDPTADRSFLVSGTVYLDSTLLADPSATTWYPAVLRHELGHLVGLDHVADPAQLMYPTTTVQTFQPGDLAGLALLGRGACAPGI
ncbi:MAG TPA: matrixin family metalloprotease [Cellulomonas sp.]